jgi:predicted DNA-binding protein
MATLQIPQELAELIEQGAQRSGETHVSFLSEAVQSRLEDLEDLDIAMERLRSPGTRIPLAEVEKNLGLSD